MTQKTQSGNLKLVREHEEDNWKLTREEVCEALTISVPTFYRLARSGRLPAARIGAEWRVKPSALARYIERRTVKPFRSKVSVPMQPNSPLE